MSEPCPNCVALLATLKGADAEITRLRATAAAEGWWCTCDRWNAVGDTCARCRKAKPVHPKRHA